jgi:hypothetical protein
VKALRETPLSWSAQNHEPRAGARDGDIWDNPTKSREQVRVRSATEERAHDIESRTNADKLFDAINATVNEAATCEVCQEDSNVELRVCWHRYLCERIGR